MKTSSYIIANDGRAAYVAAINADGRGNITSVRDTKDRSKAQTYETPESARADAEWLTSAHYTVRVEAL